MIVRRPRILAAPLLLGLISTASGPARAEGVPGHFVPSDQCMSRDCTCADGPMMEIFLRNQDKALDAWLSVRGELFSETGPQSMEEAVALFNSRFSGDARVGAQFMMCDGYDPNINKLTKIAGVPGVGEAALDPCFCNAFCKDIVDATVNHELTHAPTLLLGFANVLADKLACKTGVLPDSYCNALDPMVLADSEILSYGVGNHTLSSAISDLHDEDPQNPTMACTWEPLPEAATKRLPAPAPPPAGFWQRMGLLLQRVLHGQAG